MQIHGVAQECTQELNKLYEEVLADLDSVLAGVWPALDLLAQVDWEPQGVWVANIYWGLKVKLRSQQLSTVSLHPQLREDRRGERSVTGLVLLPTSQPVGAFLCTLLY